VPEGIRRTEAILAQAGGRRDLEAYALKGLAGLRAMTGDFEAARTLIARHRATMEEIGRKLMVGGSAQMAGYVEMLAGDAPAAERELRRGYAILDSAGDRAYLPAVAAMLASALEAQGRHAEAERYVETASSMAADGDIDTQFRLLVIRAQLLLAKGQADDTSAWCATRWRWRPTPTSWICRPRVRWSLPRRCGRRAAAALDQALRLYEEKGKPGLRGPRARRPRPDEPGPGSTARITGSPRPHDPRCTTLPYASTWQVRCGDQGTLEPGDQVMSAAMAGGLQLRSKVASWRSNADRVS
jgi:hypothetical protein